MSSRTSRVLARLASSEPQHHRRTATRLAVAAGAIAALILSGCSAAAPAPTETSVEPAAEQNLSIGTWAEPQNLMPLSQDLNSKYVSSQLYPTLLRYDENIEPQPYLASAWEAADDGLSYTFHLVEDATWTDGTPITSADVAFSFTEMIPSFQAFGKINFSVVSGIETPDEHTVVFTLSYPFAPFLKLLNGIHAPILPAHVYQGTDPNQNPNSTDPQVTGGPFMFKEWVKGDHITLVKNPDFFEPTNLDELTYKFLTDEASRTLAIRTGTVDYLPSGALPYSAIKALENEAGLTIEAKGDEGISKVFTVGFNLRKPPFDDPKVRQAISQAIDYKLIATAVSQGKETPAVGPLNSKSWGWSDELEGYEYDPEKAAKLLDAAGYPEKDGSRFSVEILTRPTVFVFSKANEIIAKNLQDIGIDAQLVPLESGPYTTRTYIDSDFGMSATAWQAGVDPNNLSPLYTCDMIRPQPYSNFMGYCNEDVDALMEQARQEQDTDKRKELYTEAQQMIIDDAPALWPMNWSDWIAYGDNIQGLPAGPWSGADPLIDVTVGKK